MFAIPFRATVFLKGGGVKLHPTPSPIYAVEKEKFNFSIV